MKISEAEYQQAHDLSLQPDPEFVRRPRNLRQLKASRIASKQHAEHFRQKAQACAVAAQYLQQLHDAANTPIHDRATSWTRLCEQHLESARQADIRQQDIEEQFEIDHALSA